MAWRKQNDRFPAPLREFVESEWPPLPGECLGKYACRGNGYGTDCVPRPGEYCGQLHYEMVGRDHPDRPDLLAAARRANAFTRYHEARLSWLPEHSDEWLTEFCEGHSELPARFARFGKTRRSHRGYTR